MTHSFSNSVVIPIPFSHFAVISQYLNQDASIESKTPELYYLELPGRVQHLHLPHLHHKHREFRILTALRLPDTRVVSFN